MNSAARDAYDRKLIQDYFGREARIRVLRQAGVFDAPALRRDGSLDPIGAAVSNRSTRCDKLFPEWSLIQRRYGRAAFR